MKVREVFALVVVIDVEVRLRSTTKPIYTFGLGGVNLLAE